MYVNIIKLNAISSTNDYLKELATTKTIANYTAVMAQFQTSGRGQMGRTWHSDSGKNLITSILIKITSLKTCNQFYLNMAISLAITAAIELKTKKYFTIKWPNDIMSDNLKVAGILIENMIAEGTIKHSIAGIGINLNQTYFKGIPNASSLKNITGKNVSPQNLLKEILAQLPFYINYIENKEFEVIKNMYLLKLYKFQKPAMFKANSGVFLGKITDVTSEGKLVIQLENNSIKTFGLKEIKLARQ